MAKEPLPVSRPVTGEIPVAPPAARGFAARLNGAALSDLIQLECMSHAPKVVRVSSGGRTALLFIREGRLVHAAAGRAQGEEALAVVLAWGEGVFERCQAPWPAVESITGSFEQVLLRAAQRLDEGRTPNVLALPVREPATTPPATKPMTKPGPTSAPPSTDQDVWVRLAPDGELLQHHGPGSEELADAVAYAAQMLDLVGHLLGLDRPAGAELTFQRGKCFLERDANGGLLAAKPAGSGTLEALRAKLGLGA